MIYKVEVFEKNGKYEVLTESKAWIMALYGTYDTKEDAITTAKELSELLNKPNKLIWKNY